MMLCWITRGFMTGCYQIPHTAAEMSWKQLAGILIQYQEVIGKEKTKYLLKHQQVLK